MLSVFDRMPDPLAAIEFMGNMLWKSGAGGCQTKEQGQVLALACMCERENPLEIARKYHIIDGKLSKKPEIMLAEFNQAGGKHRWIKSGDDGVGAELELVRPDGEKLVSSFSLEDAKTAGYVRNGGRWTKGPKAIGEMCRARCISRGMRMLMPQISAGTYTPEELLDERDSSPAASTSTSTGQSAADTEARRRELQALNAAPVASAATIAVQPEQIIEAQHEPVSKVETTATTPVVETKPVADAEVPFDVPSLVAPSSPEHRLECLALEILTIARDKMGLDEEGFDAKMKEKNPSFPGIAHMTLEIAEKVSAFLRKQFPADIQLTS